jgi:hypothetical protein
MRFIIQVTDKLKNKISLQYYEIISMKILSMKNNITFNIFD